MNIVGEFTNTCPDCNTNLDWVKGQVWGEGYYCCVRCELDYEKLNFCPDCQGAVEKLQACGATNYFCHACNSLKSKSRVTHRFVEKR